MEFPSSASVNDRGNPRASSGSPTAANGLSAIDDYPHYLQTGSSHRPPQHLRIRSPGTVNSESTSTTSSSHSEDWSEVKLTQVLAGLPVLDYSHLRYETSKTQRNESDTTVVAVKECVQFYAKGCVRLRSILCAVESFIHRQSLQVKMSNPKSAQPHELAVEDLLATQAKKLSTEAANAGAWQVMEAALYVYRFIHKYSPWMKPPRAARQERPRGELFKKDRRKFMKRLTNRRKHLFKLLTTSFRRFTRIVSEKYISPADIQALPEASDTRTGLSLRDWFHRLSEHSLEMYIKRYCSIYDEMVAASSSSREDSSARDSSSEKQPIKRGTGAELVEYIPDDEVANDRDDNTYGLRGFQWPPLHENEEPLMHMEVDKFIDSDVQRAIRSSDCPFDQLCITMEFGIGLYLDCLDSLWQILKAASLYREEGKDVIFDTDKGEDVRIESMIRNCAHKIKGGAGQLHLLKLWKAARLVELPAKQLMSNDQSYSDEERKNFLNRFTKCRNILFLWVQYRNLSVLLHRLPRFFGTTVDEIRRHSVEFEGDEGEADLSNKLRSMSTESFDSYFRGIQVYEPFNDCTWVLR
eukprot:gb/GECG01012536.1/.p1 GENE.gb/GECG01012536.1/~~gb/GECG01012536.1/.p1  ORF type:complete len:581 (+),score=63.75 gb/GECG01012536.1/:1-1743(+)